jgi:hypothetical protein
MILDADRRLSLNVSVGLQWFMATAGFFYFIPIYTSYRNDNYGFVSLYVVLGMAASAMGTLRSGLGDSFLLLEASTWDDIEILFFRWIAVFVLFSTIPFKDSKVHLQWYVFVSVLSVFSVYVVGRFGQEVITVMFLGLGLVVNTMQIASKWKKPLMPRWVTFGASMILVGIAGSTPYIFERKATDADDTLFAYMRTFWHLGAALIVFIIDTTKVIEYAPSPPVMATTRPPVGLENYHAIPPQPYPPLPVGSASSFPLMSYWNRTFQPRMEQKIS